MDLGKLENRSCQKPKLTQESLGISAVVFQPGPIGTTAYDIEPVISQPVLKLSPSRADILKKNAPVAPRFADPWKLRLPVRHLVYETGQRTAAKRIANVDFNFVTVFGKAKIERGEIGGITDP
jgi:hypothetical protein